MRNILITGANRGLGLGYTRHYISTGDRVWACYRNDPGALTELDCTPVKWDVTQPLSADQAASLPDEIHLLINNAGIYGSKGSGQALENIDQEEMLEVFRIDAVAPLLVVQTLLSRLRSGKAIIANMSSKMGSVSDNSSGGVYAYRAAKSALGIISKSMAVDLADDQIRVITLHPGWVETDMTNHTGLVDVATSVAGLTSVIDNIDHYTPGAFVAFDGNVIPF